MVGTVTPERNIQSTLGQEPTPHPLYHVYMVTVEERPTFRIEENGRTEETSITEGVMPSSDRSTGSGKVPT